MWVLRRKGALRVYATHLPLVDGWAFNHELTQLRVTNLVSTHSSCEVT